MKTNEKLMDYKISIQFHTFDGTSGDWISDQVELEKKKKRKNSSCQIISCSKLSGTKAKG
jgi:hypothetical protein